MNWLRRFPARKFFGVLMGSMAGAFALAFLGRSLVIWQDVPGGVFELVGLLTGGFGGYMWSSSYETTHGRNDRER